MSLRMMIFCGILLPTLCQAQSSLEIETTPPANPPVEHVTDERLVAYVANRMVLPSGLTVRTWRWTKEARSLGYGDYPAQGLLAQDVETYFPEAVWRTKEGFLAINYDVLIEKDVSVAQLVELCGEIYSCSDYRQYLLKEKQRRLLGE